MTSTCSQSATSATAAASSASRAKSADRMLGAIWTAMLPSLDVAPAHPWVAPRVVLGSPGRVPGAPQPRRVKLSPPADSLRRESSTDRRRAGGTPVNSDAPHALLDRVRKLLAKAEADGVTQAEAQ